MKNRRITAVATAVLLPTARRGHVVGTVANKIQLFGGENDNSGAIPTVDEYDPSTNSWETLTGYNWPTPRHGSAGAQAQVSGNTVVFLAGGALTSGAVSTVDDTDSFNRANVVP